MYGPKWPFLLMYVSRDMRRIDFTQVDRLSTNPQEMGRHRYIGNIDRYFEKYIDKSKIIQNS